MLSWDDFYAEENASPKQRASTLASEVEQGSPIPAAETTATPEPTTTAQPEPTVVTANDRKTVEGNTVSPAATTAFNMFVSV